MPTTASLKAPALRVGDAIGYFSPSVPATHFASNRYERARTFLQGKGFQLVAGCLSGKTDGYRSGTIQERAAELNTLIRNPDVRCIMSTIGGSNSNSLLPYIDYEALRKDPKIIIGYSDVTAILLGIYAKTGLISFYGPALVASFGEFHPLVDETFHSFSELLLEKVQGPHTYTLPEYWTDMMIPWEEQKGPKEVQPNTCKFFGEGVVQGRLIGGNLNTLWGIWGTEYMPLIEQGDILLIEDSLKPIATVERLFSFLKLNGIFDKVGGVLLGKHELLKDEGTGRTSLDVLREVLNGQEIPLVYDFDCAHTHPMLTMPLGTQVEIDFDKKQVRALGQWLAPRS